MARRQALAVALAFGLAAFGLAACSPFEGVDSAPRADAGHVDDAADGGSGEDERTLVGADGRPRALVDSKDLMALGPLNSSDVGSIGAARDPLGFFKGTIDDVFVVDRALGPEEVAGLKVIGR